MRAALVLVLALVGCPDDGQPRCVTSPDGVEACRTADGNYFCYDQKWQRSIYGDNCKAEFEEYDE